MVRRFLPLIPLALVLAACGSGGGSASEDVAQAATKTNSVKSYAVATSTTMNVADKAVTFTGAGAFDVTKRRGKLSLDLRNFAEVGQNLGTVTMILNGFDLYLRMPFLRSVAPQLKPWLKVNLQQAGRSQGLDLSAFLQLGQGGDPTQSLQYLRGASDVKKKGSEEVRGVDTTHYEMTVDLRRVADKAPQQLRARLRNATAQIIRVTGQRKVPVEIWVDDQSLVRRFVQRQKIPIQGKRTDMTLRMELFDFGTSVSAAPPPASQVTDLSRALPEGQG
jgi:hypothetical protein